MKVAFHARCARQVLRLWEEAWPEAPHEHHEAIEQAIVLSEMCAAEGKPVGDLKAAAARATHVAEAAVAESTGGPAPIHPTWAGLIAAAAGSTIDLITGVDDGGSYTFAKVLAVEADRDEMIEDLQEDFRHLRQLTRDGEWTDATPIPPEVFDPAYKAKKSWWKKW